jgi:tight adherence protein C
MAMTPSAVLAGVAVALATAGLPDLLGRRRRAVRPLARRGTGERPPPAVPTRRLPGLLAPPGGLFERLGGRWRAAESAARLEAAGLDGEQAPQLAAVRGAAALAGLAVAGVLAPGLSARLALLTLFAGPSAGFLGPDLWLRRRARERGRAIAAELADVLELLRVAAGAGLSVRRALSEVARRHPGVLAAELGRAAARMSLGTPEDAALAALERRCPAVGVPALTAALARAQRFGAPLTGTLAAQAEQARVRQAQRCAEAAARASPKIQLVVALLLVPSVLLLVAAALIPALVPS